MRVPIYQVDAFTGRRFAGNPAAVMLVEAFPDDATMLAIAAENNLAETAFLVVEDGAHHLRWFTPAVEVPLCGHATLATAAVVMERLEPGRREVVFRTLSGALPVRRTEEGYVLNFPVRRGETVDPPKGLAEALGAIPREVVVDRFNYLVRLDDAATVRTLHPDITALARLDRSGVIVTGDGDPDYDFVSRYFAPAKGIDEDPVTGGAHCALVPYWAERLGRDAFLAYQASARGGVLRCRLLADRVELEGRCVFYLEGQAEI